MAELGISAANPTTSTSGVTAEQLFSGATS